MRWPWQRPETPPDADESRGLDEANAALEESLARWAEVRQVTSQIRRIRRENHLAEITARALIEIHKGPR